MKISELVKQLNEIASKHGDLKVVYIESECGYSCEFDEFELGTTGNRSWDWFERLRENEKPDTVCLY